jgi:rod shape-determining protein MreD
MYANKKYASKITFLITIVIAAVIQVSLLTNFFPNGSVPNLVLILVIMWVVKAGFMESWPVVVLAGAVLDLVYGWTVGLNIIALAIIAFGSSSFAKRFLISRKGLGFFIMLGLVAGGTIFYALLILFVVEEAVWLGNIHPDSSSFGAVSPKTFWIILSNCLGFILLYWPMKKFEKFFHLYQKDKLVKTRFMK